MGLFEKDWKGGWISGNISHLGRMHNVTSQTGAGNVVT